MLPMGRLHAVKSQDYVPQKWYPLVSKGGRISTELTPRGAAKTRVIYVFKNTVTGELLIGKTGQKVLNRVRQYNSMFNHPEKDYGKGAFPTAVREKPENFVFGILHELRMHESLEWWERALIIAYNSMNQGYNQNRGGGGGAAIKAEAAPKAETSQSKSYQFDVDNKGWARVQLTPGAKKFKNVVYAIEKNKGEKVYIGMSSDLSAGCRSMPRQAAIPKKTKDSSRCQRPSDAILKLSPHA